MKQLGCNLIWLTFFICILFPTRVSAQPCWEVEYQKARKVYYEFKSNKQRQKFRHHWKNTARAFELIAKRYPNSKRAPDALFTSGRLYYELYTISRVTEDLDHAIKLFQRLVEKYPNNHLADDAQLYIALQWVEFRKKPERARQELMFLVKHFPRNDVTPKARNMLEDLGGPLAEPYPASANIPKKVKAKVQAPSHVVREKSVHERENAVLEEIKYDSAPDYTRIALFTRTQPEYKFDLLPVDKQHNYPRLYVDLMHVSLDPNLKGPIEVRDSVVRRIRFALFSKDVLRVVLDLNQTGDYKVFPMDSPARVVVDVSTGHDVLANIIGEKTVAKARIPKTASKPGKSFSDLVGLKIRTVVIDPGHGGEDPGAIGPTGKFEKDIVLDISKRLARLLREDENLGLQKVKLTRTIDHFLGLEKRTAIANKEKADLFISVHCNAHRNRTLRGVETFYLDLTDDRYSRKLAARENATSEKTISDLRYILADLALKSHVDDSIMLGTSIQRATIGTLRRNYNKIEDRKLKPALFYVLIGARMPSVLIETSFISNPEEEKRLCTQTYRQKLAEGIYTGVKNFIVERRRVWG